MDNCYYEVYVETILMMIRNNNSKNTVNIQMNNAKL